MLGINLNGVNAAGGSTMIEPGGYVIEITKVKNNTTKFRLEFEFDIVKGPYAGCYTAPLRGGAGRLSPPYPPIGEACAEPSANPLSAGGSILCPRPPARVQGPGDAHRLCGDEG